MARYLAGYLAGYPARYLAGYLARYPAGYPAGYLARYPARFQISARILARIFGQILAGSGWILAPGLKVKLTFRVFWHMGPHGSIGPQLPLQALAVEHGVLISANRIASPLCQRAEVNYFITSSSASACSGLGPGPRGFYGISHTFTYFYRHISLR